MALSGHRSLHRTRPLSGVKRTCRFALHMSAFDPKRTSRLQWFDEHVKVSLAQKANGDDIPGGKNARSGYQENHPAGLFDARTHSYRHIRRYVRPYGSYRGTQLWCPILDGCNTVVNSPYSRVLGVPMSYFGFIYYLFMFGLAARLAYEPASKSLRFRIVLYAALGAVSSDLLYLSPARPH